MWFTSQQADEPERPEDLRDVLDWIGWDRLLFATDYPHWDMDNPEFVFKCTAVRSICEQTQLVAVCCLFGSGGRRRERRLDRHFFEYCH